LLELLHADSVETEQRRFSLPAVAAAVIHYCWKSRIPIMRSASKTIEIVPEGFALVLQATVEVPRRHGAIANHAPADAGALEEEAPGSEAGAAGVRR